MTMAILAQLILVTPPTGVCMYSAMIRDAHAATGSATMMRVSSTVLPTALANKTRRVRVKTIQWGGTIAMVLLLAVPGTLLEATVQAGAMATRTSVKLPMRPAVSAGAASTYKQTRAIQAHVRTEDSAAAPAQATLATASVLVSQASLVR